MTQLDVVSVASHWSHDESSGTGSLLVNLFPDDIGYESPNPANVEWLPNHNLAWGASLPGQPFCWAQWLAGLTFLKRNPELGQSSKIPQEQFRVVVARVQARIQSHATLEEELKVLRSKGVQVTSAQTASLFQMAPTANFSV